jgi:hypothetical protein
MHFEYILVADWPRLAWVVQLETRSDTIHVFHGACIEVNKKWFCEATWDGTFCEGGFDHTDIVAGTGGHIRDSGTTFVSSGNTLDRLQFIRKKEHVWLSNSLPGLLSMVGGDVNPAYSGYLDDLRSIVNGVQNYKRDLETSTGSVSFVYFNNLVWYRHELIEQEKPGGKGDFTSFSCYRSFLDSTFTQLARNMMDQARKHPFEMLSTVSSGYDSTTVSALAKQAGCTDALCFTEAQSGVQENGPEIARILGLNPIALDRKVWRASGPFPEAPFIVGDGIGMDLPFKAAESILQGRVLLSGYHGDKVWAKNTEDVSENIVRGDQSGLSLSEFRLATGFLHCAVPFWGVRQIQDLQAISNDAEMSPWDIPGDYSRPICRRIVEEAGVPRSHFGTKKAAAAFLFGTSPTFLSSPSMSDYRHWLKVQQREWVTRGMRPPLRRIRWIDSSYWLIVNILSSTTKTLLTWAEGKPIVWRLTKRKTLLKMSRIIRKNRLRVRGIRAYVFPWALAKQIQVYGKHDSLKCLDND